MSFANVQQVSVSQGPIQRLFGIADLHVQSAGGGGGDENLQQKAGDSLHTGVFHGVANAQEIRDLVLTRLRDFRDTGLGDFDDAPTPPAAPATECNSQAELLGASRAMLEELRSLRVALAERRL